jgi:ketosteroid isomerase-like protein
MELEMKFPLSICTPCAVLVLGLVMACQPVKMTPPIKVSETRTVMGMKVLFDVSSGNLAEVEQLMSDFGRAFATLDGDGLRKITSEDFVWYQNTMDEGPTGRKLEGVDAMLGFLRNRAGQWSEVRYTDNEFYATSSKIIHTYHVMGIDLETGAFDANGMDIYTLRDGKIAVKDSYWKRD